MDTDDSVMIARERGWEEAGEGKGGINGDGRRLYLGW